MNKREQFLTFVFLGALHADIQNDTMHAQQIAMLASEIPEEQIPPECPMNAAKVFLAYCGGMKTRPFRWMYV
jgi:hypothetical protein